MNPTKPPPLPPLLLASVRRIEQAVRIAAERSAESLTLSAAGTQSSQQRDTLLQSALAVATAPLTNLRRLRPIYLGAPMAATALRVAGAMGRRVGGCRIRYLSRVAGVRETAACGTYRWPGWLC